MKKKELKTPEELRTETGETQIHFAENYLDMSYRSYQLRLSGKMDYYLKDLKVLCEIAGGSVLIPKTKFNGKAYKISITEI